MAWRHSTCLGPMRATRRDRNPISTFLWTLAARIFTILNTLSAHTKPWKKCSGTASTTVPAMGLLDFIARPLKGRPFGFSDGSEQDPAQSLESYPRRGFGDRGRNKGSILRDLPRYLDDPALGGAWPPDYRRSHQDSPT